MKHQARKRINYVTAAITIIVVIAVGIMIVRFSSAATQFHFEAETGVRSGAATVVNNAAASAGKAIAFGGGVAPTPTATPSTTPSSTPSGTTYAQVLAMVDAFAAANKSGTDSDINREPGYSKPGAGQLRAVCGEGWISIYPRLAWEYVNPPRPWINPLASPLLICVKPPQTPPYFTNWSFANNKVTATVFVKFPQQSPCGEKLMDCMKTELSNMDILGDEAGGGASEGSKVGLDLTSATTDLYLRVEGSLQFLYFIP